MGCKRLEPYMNCSFLSHYNHFCSFEKSPREWGKHWGQPEIQAGKPVGRLLHNLCDKMMKMGTGVEWNEEWEEIGAGRHLGFKFSEGLDFCGDR